MCVCVCVCVCVSVCVCGYFELNWSFLIEHFYNIIIKYDSLSNSEC